MVPGETCHLSRAVTTVPVAASYLTVHQALMTISLAANVTHIVFDGIYTREWLAGATFTGTGIISIGFHSDVTGIAHVFLYETIMAEVDTYVAATEAPVAIYPASGLSPGPHGLTIELTGTPETLRIAGTSGPDGARAKRLSVLSVHPLVTPFPTLLHFRSPTGSHRGADGRPWADHEVASSAR